MSLALDALAQSSTSHQNEKSWCVTFESLANVNYAFLK